MDPATSTATDAFSADPAGRMFRGRTSKPPITETGHASECGHALASRTILSRKFGKVGRLGAVSTTCAIAVAYSAYVTPLPGTRPPSVRPAAERNDQKNSKANFSECDSDYDTSSVGRFVRSLAFPRISHP